MATALRQITPAAEAEAQVRADLAAAHRLAHRFGFDDGIHNHFTHVVPGRNDRFLVKPHGLLMSEVSASNLIVVDADGRTVEGEGRVERTALNIHAAMHLAIPQAECILHAHPPHATWLASIMDNRLRMVNQNSIRFYRRIAYDDHYAGVATARAEGERMVKAVGNHRAAIHANHGLTTLAPTVAEAFYEFYYLEKACEEYHMVIAAGQEPRIIPDEICKATVKDFEEEYMEAATLGFAAWKRMLDAEEPDYAQ